MRRTASKAFVVFFFSSRRRHTRLQGDWSSDVCSSDLDVIREARVIFDNYSIETEILAASIRHPRHVVEAAMIGADVATLPPDVLKKLLLHPLTDRGLDQFLADWNKLVARAKAAV